MSDRNNIPAHIAIIMDGNGRWAKERNLPRTAGHHKGISRIKEIVKAARELKIRYLTLFAFSTENWQRPKSEVSMLMRALDNFLKNELEEMDSNNIRLLVIGRDKPIPDYLRKRIKYAQEYTQDNTGLTLIVALNYGARQEIVDAVKKFTLSVIQGNQNLDDLNEQNFPQFLYSASIPDPDLLIRTSGEFRISNFLLWQISYTELYFVDKYWPDFDKEDLQQAISKYQNRERRFGHI
jgi:undecaprenyl diphosphate synthase